MMLARLIGAALLLAGFSAGAEAACTIPRPIDQPRTGAPNLSTYTNDYTVITGGCIDGTPIGQNTPAAGNFTHVGSADIINAAGQLGFVGDGITVNSDSLWTTAMAYTTSPTIYFGPGTYLLSCPTAHNSASAISLMGAGRGVTTLKFPTGCVLPNTFLTWNGQTGVRVAWMTLDMNGATHTGAVATILAGIGLIDSSFDHLRIINIGSGLIDALWRSDGPNGSVNHSITDNYISYQTTPISNTQCISVSSSGGSSQSNSQGEVSRNICVNAAIIASGHNITFDSNDVTGWGYGCGITTAADVNTYDLTIVNNRLHDSATVVDSQGGCGLESWAKNSTIANNLAYNNATGGIANGGAYSTVTGNVTYGNGTKSGGAGTVGGIVARYQDGTYNASNSVVSGNRSYDGGGGTQTYGYVENANLTGIRLAANDFDGNATGNLSLVTANATSYDAMSAGQGIAGEVLISTQTASNSAALTFTGLTGFTDYKIVCRGMQSDVAAGADWLVQVGEGNTPTWNTSASYYSNAIGLNAASGTAVTRATKVSEGVLLNGTAASLAANSTARFEIQFGNITATNFFKHILFRATYPITGAIEEMSGSGMWSGDQGALTAIRLVTGTLAGGASGNILIGSCSLYGRNT